jgi:hypothetical protein
VLDRDIFLHRDAVRASRNLCAGENTRAFATSNRRQVSDAGLDLGNNSQGPVGLAAAKGVTVDGRTIEAR